MKSLKRHLACLLGATLLLSACGGGGSQVTTFYPTRILSFGDETSVLRSDGTKYTVNATDTTTGAITCASNPIWVQSLANNYGLVFKECNPSNLAATTGVMYAAYGAKVADVSAQVDKQFSLDGFTNKDLVTVLAGANDILELYGRFGAQDTETLGAEAQARGAALADVVNRIAAANGRVIVSTMQDMGLTPYAIREKSTHADTDRAAVMTELSRRFNVGLRLRLTNDGTKIGLILSDETLQAVAKYAAYYSMTNVTEGSCLASALPPVCTDKTLVTNATAAGYMWAGDTLLGPTDQARIGSLAVTRATNNPF